MALTLRAGQNAYASGFCCVAIGDDTSARGAFQVSLGTKLTLPDDPSLDTPEKKIEGFTTGANTVREFIAIYSAMGEQGHASAEFVEKANSALNILLDTLNKRIEALRVLSGTTSISTAPAPPASRPPVPTPNPNTPAPAPPLSLQQPPSPAPGRQ